MIEKSKEIVERAISEYKPYAKVGLFSGGNDSLALLEVLKELGVELDFVIHVHTGTGLPQTLEFVREHCSVYGDRYLELSAGTAYEDYVLRKGFFGKGVDAHAYAYHTLKVNPLERGISGYIRQRKRGRKVLLFNGVRINESENRKYNFGLNEITVDRRKQNDVWVKPKMKIHIYHD
jgi:3'-phosphoadenosine 5'-phosphosulfate sulfotransferase (PAPS reductase)/FAD synthetase